MSDLAHDLPAILSLLADYARHMDARDAHAWSQLFAAGGTFVFRDQTVTGPADLLEFAETSPTGLHLSGVPSVQADGDGLYLAESNYIFVNPSKRHVVTGSYRDRIRDGGERFVFVERHAEMHGFMKV